MTEIDTHWHLDKKVPITMIMTFVITVLVQTGGTLWWAASVSIRLESLERRTEISAPHADRLTRVEVKIESIRESLDRIERLVRQERTPAR